jgi:hypothetical protein
LTVPSRVQKNRYWSSRNSRTATIERILVSGPTLIRLTIGLPRVARPACGISWTLSQKQRPSSVKIMM